MTPTADTFEDRLLDALLDRFDSLAYQPPAAVASLPRGPAFGATPFRWQAWPSPPRRRR